MKTVTYQGLYLILMQLIFHILNHHFKTNKMIIRREKRSERFSVLNTEPIEDKNLSAVALGIYVYIMSKPDNWNAHKNEILKRFSDATIKTTKNSIDSAFSELIKAGYIVLVTPTQKLENGQVRFSGKEYVFFDTPQFSKDEDSRKTKILDSREFPKIEKPRKSRKLAHITNTDLLTNTKEIINNDFKTKFKESEINFAPTPEKKLEIVFPFSFSEELKEKIKNFIKYRKEIKKPFKSNQSIHELIKKIEKVKIDYSDFEIIEIINLSITNGWQGLFFEKIEEVRAKKPQTQPQQTAKEKAFQHIPPPKIIGTNKNYVTPDGDPF
jgi:hypothetical protein